LPPPPEGNKDEDELSSHGVRTLRGPPTSPPEGDSASTRSRLATAPRTHMITTSRPARLQDRSSPRKRDDSRTRNDANKTTPPTS
jgi:hypothetical protein